MHSHTIITLIIMLLCLPSSLCSKGICNPGGGAVYCVIVGTGMNKLLTPERYWNDCSFLYRTLRHDYRLPGENITVLMSDGGEPGDDYLRADGGGFDSSSADLDGDGQRDVFLAATLQNFVGHMSTLTTKLGAADHLMIFLMGHGENTVSTDRPSPVWSDDGSSAYLLMWNGDRLTARLLAQLTAPLGAGSVCIVAGQCYSGGFIDCLSAEGRIVCTACRADELSWNCPDRLYDEFVYHWTCAIAGHDEQGTPVDADSNADGRITMAEAFHYAARHDRRPETPQYSSTPEDLGQRWTFSGLLPEDYDGIIDIQSSGRLPAARTLQPSLYDLMGRPASVQGDLHSPPIVAQGKGWGQQSPRKRAMMKKGKIIIK